MTDRNTGGEETETETNNNGPVWLECPFSEKRNDEGEGASDCPHFELKEGEMFSSLANRMKQHVMLKADKFHGHNKGDIPKHTEDFIENEIKRAREEESLRIRVDGVSIPGDLNKPRWQDLDGRHRNAIILKVITEIHPAGKSDILRTLFGDKYDTSSSVYADIAGRVKRMRERNILMPAEGQSGSYVKDYVLNDELVHIPEDVELPDDEEDEMVDMSDEEEVAEKEERLVMRTDEERRNHETVSIDIKIEGGGMFINVDGEVEEDKLDNLEKVLGGLG